jgi:hypothetical protein
MSRVFCGLAALLFFFHAVGVTIIPKPEAWGLVCLAVGCAVGGVAWAPWKKTA